MKITLETPPELDAAIVAACNAHNSELPQTEEPKTPEGYIGFVINSAVLSWARQYGVDVPSDTPPVDVDAVPGTIERWQLIAALQIRGLYSKVAEALGSIQDPAAKIIASSKFGAITVIRRNHEIVSYVAAVVQLDDAAVDELFKFAGSLK